jgi:pyruvate/2-oxoglutarate/acetoin dehydrogenase E1 component/TPP-dependent pyruvate/acetoin dehydrogenase alpha subunit
MPETLNQEAKISFQSFKQEVLADYRLAVLSREASLTGRKEVLTGKAKFGIFGDGKELPQLALAKQFMPGDFRSGYYRDQTWMFAAGISNVAQFFAQLYATPDVNEDPFSAGRQMNAHFATRSLDENGNWRDIANMKNSAADTSPTAGQMVRALGLAQASKLYRENPELKDFKQFSNNGNEVVFTSIGDASTSEGVFWETLNAAGVLRVPLAVSIWDDGYGISVPKKYQTTKGNISTILEGFRVNEKGEGYDIYVVKGWDYPALCAAYEKGVKKIRETHIPAIFHIIEVTQPQGHSTSGSHERYKSKERLEWEKEYDGIKKMREWMLDNKLADENELNEIDNEARKEVSEARRTAWSNYTNPIKDEISSVCALMENMAANSAHAEAIRSSAAELQKTIDPFRRDIYKAIHKALRLTALEMPEGRSALMSWLETANEANAARYNSHLFSESDKAALKVKEVPAIYSADSPQLNGFEIVNKCFDNLLANYPNVVAFGEDVGKIGDVNQGFAGMQDKYGEHRVSDVGIREATIMGQAMGLAMRGIRPIAEIQYLDYLLYGLQPLSDDLATLQYRTRGGQKAPCIIRTRGHRLEGIWHTGSPMGMILHSLRGIHVLVPRNMTQAAGFYNTMIQSDEPALIIECLNGYRLKETLPDNLSEFTLPLGKVETLQAGTDLTMVSYGSTLRICEEAMQQLAEFNISVELIDAQSLLPFDLAHDCVKSLQKTNRLVVVDEDVPGGASAYILQQILEVQGGYRYLDEAPMTIAAKAHRAAYASDGDYFSKPNAEDIFHQVYNMIRASNPSAYPSIL